MFEAAIAEIATLAQNELNTIACNSFGFSQNLTETLFIWD